MAGWIDRSDKCGCNRRNVPDLPRPSLLYGNNPTHTAMAWPSQDTTCLSCRMGRRPTPWGKERQAPTCDNYKNKSLAWDFIDISLSQL
ncbi:Uncharacterized protein HZ326_1244 [Fusarium oxysporum f. sp. albedinis]|nr:Uncharacterized protein HZ326_1244 [Fusarium oxysporum f. sp. albedinis]